MSCFLPHHCSMVIWVGDFWPTKPGYLKYYFWDRKKVNSYCQLIAEKMNFLSPSSLRQQRENWRKGHLTPSHWKRREQCQGGGQTPSRHFEFPKISPQQAYKIPIWNWTDTTAVSLRTVEPMSLHSILLILRFCSYRKTGRNYECQFITKVSLAF